VDRIINSREVEKDGSKVVEYLVKWKQLPYEEATWEFKEDFNDDQKIAEYEAFNKFPSQYERIPSKKFTPLEKSPEYKGGIA
jgi:chromodomain helicase DNA binding protein 8